MIYNNAKFGGAINRLLEESVYAENFPNAEPMPPPDLKFLLDNSGEALLDNSDEPFLTSK